jgi:hypothetical protein
MIDLLVFGMMVVKDGASMVKIIVIMISQLIFGLMEVLKYGSNMVKIIEIMIDLLLFGLMEICNIGLMGRKLSEYL